MAEKTLYRLEQDVKLDQIQKEAVNHKKGPLLIRAGPGSGKTRVIIERIAHLVNDCGFEASEILCITYTRKAAGEMQARLAKRGVKDSEKATICTFHSLASSILEEFTIQSGISMSGGIITTPSQAIWGIGNIDSFNFEYLTVGNNGEDLIRSIMEGIRMFKDMLIAPDRLAEYLDSKTIDDEEVLGSLTDLHKVYVRYQDFLTERKMLDYPDLVVESVKLLEGNEMVRKKLQQRYRYVLIDELQDINYAQLRLAELISSDGNVTAVGDDDQMIYRFQGAYTKSFEDFEERFQNTKKVGLETNYRSTQNIMDLAGQVISTIKDRQPKDLKASVVAERGPKIVIRRCLDEMSQAKFVADQIDRLSAEQGGDTTNKPADKKQEKPKTAHYREFAVLTRNRDGGEVVARLLKARGHTVNFVGAKISGLPVLNTLLAYLNMIKSPATSGQSLTRLMQDRGIDELNIARINHYARKRGGGDESATDGTFEVLQYIDQYEDITQKTEIKEFAVLLHKLTRLSVESPYVMLYKVIMEMSGLYKRAICKSGSNRRDKALLEKILEHAAEYGRQYKGETTEHFVSYMDMLLNHDLMSDEDAEEEEDGVLVTTIHQGKGREFDTVFLVDAAKQKLPSRFRSKKFYVPSDLSEKLVGDQDERTLHILDEKRLFYVAATRAKKRLYISYAKNYETRTQEAAASEFLDEINYETNPLVDFQEYAESEEPVLENVGGYVDKLKRDRRDAVVNALGSDSLKTTAQKIVELDMIKYYEEHGTTDGFDPAVALGDVDADSLKLVGEQLLGDVRVQYLPTNFAFSATKINTYRDCPLKFKFQHVLNVPGSPKPFLNIGNAIHAVAEVMPSGVLEGRDETTAEEDAWGIFEQKWDVIPYRRQEKKRGEDAQSAKDVIRTYLEWVRNNPNKLVGTEVPFTVVLNGSEIKGKIDRIEQRPDGEYEVVDFKTGSSMKPKKTIKEDVQLNVYAMGIKELHNKLPKRASLVYLKNDKIIPYDIDCESFDAAVEGLRETIKEILDEKNDFSATPSSKVCRYCDYNMICDEKV